MENREQKVRMWSTNGLGSRCLAPSNSRIRDVRRILETKRQHLVKSEDTQSTGDANEGYLFYFVLFNDTLSWYERMEGRMNKEEWWK